MSQSRARNAALAALILGSLTRSGLLYTPPAPMPTRRSPIGRTPTARSRSIYEPHQGARECARRRAGGFHRLRRQAAARP